MQTLPPGHVRHKSMDTSVDKNSFLTFDTSHHHSSLSIGSAQPNVNDNLFSSPKSFHPELKKTKARIFEKSENILHNIDFETDTLDGSKKDETSLNFNKNREQWQKRASSQPHIQINKKPDSSHLQRQNHTPDLVMDLPLENSLNPKEITKKLMTPTNLFDDSSGCDVDQLPQVESPTGPESPDMSTAAERFAKQNQCTLKKNTKIHVESVASDEEKLVSDLIVTADKKYNTMPNPVPMVKPQIKAKPPLLKKTVFSVPLPAVSAEVRRNDQEDLPS